MNEWTLVNHVWENTKGNKGSVDVMTSSDTRKLKETKYNNISNK